MRSRVTATEASRRFSAILDRVQQHGEEFVVERANEPVCAIVPVAPHRRTVADLAAFLRDVPAPDRSFERDVRAVRRAQPRASRKSP